MADALTALEEMTQDTVQLEAAVKRCRTKNVGVDMVQPTARKIARTYFDDVRHELLVVETREGRAEEIDFYIQAVLELSSSAQKKGRYTRHFKDLRQCLSQAMFDVLRSRGQRRLVLSNVEAAIIDTLNKLLPAATAAAYEQALRDIRSGDRVSWRGTANEFREIFREVIDHLAPDAKVVDAVGYKHEEGRVKPTQRQKVRFILKVRRSGSNAIAVAESSLEAAEEAIAVLARSTYQRSNTSTHTATGGTEIRNLKRYVDALLGELLEIRV